VLLRLLQRTGNEEVLAQNLGVVLQAGGRGQSNGNGFKAFNLLVGTRIVEFVFQPFLSVTFGGRLTPTDRFRGGATFLLHSPAFVRRSDYIFICPNGQTPDM
jgi:hypothetical protein